MFLLDTEPAAESCVPDPLNFPPVAGPGWRDGDALEVGENAKTRRDAKGRRRISDTGVPPVLVASARAGRPCHVKHAGPAAEAAPENSTAARLRAPP